MRRSKAAQSLNGRGILQRILRQINHSNFRKRGANLLALKRIVVEESERIDTNVQFLSDLTEILCLVGPIDAHRREVFCAHQHARMLLQRFHGIVEIVLAAYRQQNSFARQIEQGTVQGLIGGARIFGADFDAGHSVFADHAAPQRVVEIDDQNLGGAAAEGHDETHPLARHLKKITGGDGKPRRQPLALVVPMLAAMARHQRVVVEAVHAVESGGDVPQFTD